MINFEKYSDTHYDILCIDYEKENGIREFSSISELKEYITNNTFYKLYIFNQDIMDEYINTCEDILLNSKNKAEINEVIYTKKIYTCTNKKLNIVYYLDNDLNISFYYSGIEG